LDFPAPACYNLNTTLLAGIAPCRPKRLLFQGPNTMSRTNPPNDRRTTWFPCSAWKLLARGALWLILLALVWEVSSNSSSRLRAEYPVPDPNTATPANPTLQFSAFGYSVGEADGSATITVTLNPAATTEVRVDYATFDGSAIASSDYSSTSGTLIFAAGQTSKTFTVTIEDDSIIENDETIALTLSNPVNAAIGTQSIATLTIVDNDPPLPIVRFFDYIFTAVEGDGTATIIVILDPAATTEVRVDYATSNGSAVDPSDYLATSGTLIFAPGETSKSFAVTVVDDSTSESNETVGLSLSNPVNAVLGTQESASLALIDNDSPSPTVQFSASNYSVQESAGTATITVTLAPAATEEVTVGYLTWDGTAISGLNYVSISDQLVFAPGDTSKTFTVTLLNDGVFGPNKTVNLALSNPVNAGLGQQASATLTIVESNSPSPMVQFDATEYSVSEGAATVTITVVLDQAADHEVRISFATSDGTALVGSDYSSANGELVFAVGDTSKTMTISILDDNYYEDTEYLYVVLSSPVGSVLGENYVSILSILDDDPNGEQAPLSVTASASSPDPSPGAIRSPISVDLSAVANNPPVPQNGVIPSGATWTWSIQNVQYKASAEGTFQPAAEGSYSASISHPTAGNSFANLDVTVQLAGYWSITTRALVAYTDTVTGAQLVSAHDDLDIIFGVAWPALVLTAEKSAICAGAFPTSVHQTVLTVVARDSQGNLVEGVAVTFSTTQGQLSTGSASTNEQGIATTVLTSSQQASHGEAQVIATVTVALENQPEITANAQVEFKAPTIQIAPDPTEIGNTENSTITVTLTFDNEPVPGHIISLAISRILSDSEQVIYSGTGPVPTGYGTLTYTQTSTDSNGIVTATLTGGETPCFIEILAADNDVFFVDDGKNPEKKAIVAVAQDLTLRAIEFKTDHKLICDGDLFYAGKPFWTANDPDHWKRFNFKNAPITMTAGANNNIIVEITLYAPRLQAPTFIDISASSPLSNQGAMKDPFRFTLVNGVLKQGFNRFRLVARDPVGDIIKVLRQTITWQADFGPIGNKRHIDLGQSGEHVVYLTVGTPITDTDAKATVPTVKRMELAIDEIKKSANDKPIQNYAQVVWNLSKQNSQYYLIRGLYGNPIKTNNGSLEVYYLPLLNDPVQAFVYDRDINKGADCRSIAEFNSHMLKLVGFPGTWGIEKYAADYRTPAIPRRPLIAVAGRDLLAPKVKAGNPPYGPTHTQNLQATYFLALADYSCVKEGNPNKVAPGTEGCGQQGFNAFEATVIYSTPAGVKWYFPAGTGACYNHPDKILFVFATLAWIDTVQVMENGVGVDKVLVQKVDYNYGAPYRSDTP
jgi:Calx-beta domain/Bacterial Ig-like domain (group 1)